MTNPEDDPIESLLQERFQGPVPDDGFSIQVMQRLSGRSRFTGWPVAMGGLTGFLACCVCLSSAALPQISWHDWFYGRLSSSEIVLFVGAAGMSLLGVAWMIAEADDASEKALFRL